jgi:hypothetical protein
MLKLGISARDTPLVLQPDVEQEGSLKSVVGEISIENIRDNKDRQCLISSVGGVKAVWKVIYQQRVPSKNGKITWGTEEVLKRFELDVVGEMELKEGKTRYVGKLE